METKKNITLKAFTLIELAITLIITGIVISFIIASFHIITKLHIRFKNKTETINQFEKLNYLLHKDNLESQMILKNGANFVFQKEGQSIEYRVIENNLVRIQEFKKDTFELSDLKTFMRFQNTEVEVNDKIDVIILDFKNDKQIIINKEYASKELMK